MPIRKITIHACLTGVVLASSTQVSANDSQWNGSYAANGQCYCSGSAGQKIDSIIVPTPVGGQSIAQVCERLGAGPTLQKVDGKYNFTVYADRQCGNDQVSDQNCLGHLGVAGEDCESAGPQWDLAAAYAETTTVASVGISDTVTSTGISRYIQPPTNTVAVIDAESVEQEQKIDAAANTLVAEIVETRKSATQVATAPVVEEQVIFQEPEYETRESIRARQLVHLEAARERAALKQQELAQADSVVESVEAASAIITESVASNTAEPIAVPAPVTVPAVEPVVEPTIAAASRPSALQYPLALNRGSRDFNFVEASPVIHHFGGAGARLSASASSHNLIQYVARGALLDDYQEVSFGLGAFITPQSMPRATFMVSGGVESGRHEFTDDLVSVELSSTGAFAEAAARFALTPRLKLQGGVNYSSFFEGDILGFGEALFNITNNLDFSSRVEAGDNDLFGFGIRYHY